MNVPAAISIAAGALAIAVGLVARRFSRAPGWGDQRWFGLIAYGAAAYAFGNLPTTLNAAPRIVTLLSRVQLAAVLVQLWAWFRYVDALLGRRPPPWERRALLGLFLLAALCLAPGLVYGDATAQHVVPLLGTRYTEAVPMAGGELLFAAGLFGAVVVLVRLVAAWRRGRDEAGPIALAFAAILVFGVNDAVAGSGVLPLPYLLDVGFMVPVGAVAWGLTRRFVADAELLHGLRARLESLVEERTRELAKAEEALHQAERLASLGQFAAGVAHEVNNPAAVVTANLRFLAETALEDGAPPEAQASIRDSIEAMRRINALVRRLVDAGRMASMPTAAGASLVNGVAEQAVAEARARTGERVAYAVRVPPGAQVRVRPEALHQILSALLLNAGDAVPPGRRGRVELAAERTEAGRLRLSVSDDGAGMSPEVRRRAFEPFFTTKGEGQGSGLGLSVARALAESNGGELRLESQEGRGTVAVLDLPEAPPGT